MMLAVLLMLGTVTQTVTPTVRASELVTDLSELSRHPTKYEKKWVLTRGFAFAEQGYAYLFAFRKDVSPNNLHSSNRPCRESGVLRCFESN